MAISSDNMDKLKTHAYYSALILKGESQGRDVIIEMQDGEFILAYRAYVFLTHGVAIENIERITIFKDGEGFEFVATL